MPEDRDGPAFLAHLSAELMTPESVEMTVQTVLAQAHDVVPDADLVSLTMTGQQGFVTLGATLVIAEQADQLQYELSQGPCVDAATDWDWVRSGDVLADVRWPAWGPKAAALGVSSMLAIRLTGMGDTMGAINMYSAEVGRFTEPETVDLALLYAVHAATALKSARLVDGLRTALDSRHIIGAAQGILMSSYGLSLDRSFEVLRRYSNDLNRKVRDVAEEIVAQRRLPEAPARDRPMSTDVG